MAEIAYTFAQPARGVLRITWASMANGDTGAWFDVAQYGDISVHLFGTFGVGGQCDIEASNESGTPANPVIAQDPTATTALSLTTPAKIRQKLELSGQLRPNISAGDGATALTLIMECRRT